MTYKLSHNDYFCENQFYDAVKNNCNIVEVDIILKGNEIMLSHSWKPFKFMCHGTLSDYLRKVVNYNHHQPKDKRIILYIDFKTGNEKVIKILNSIIAPYTHKVKVLVKGTDKYLFQRVFMAREFAAGVFWSKYSKFLDVELYEDFESKHYIARVDLYEDSIWHF